MFPGKNNRGSKANLCSLIVLGDSIGFWYPHPTNFEGSVFRISPKHIWIESVDSTIQMWKNILQEVLTFAELLNYRVWGRDKDLEKYLERYSKNASRIPKRIQNELIQPCGEIIKENFLQDIKTPVLFSYSWRGIRDVKYATNVTCSQVCW